MAKRKNDPRVKRAAQQRADFVRAETDKKVWDAARQEYVAPIKAKVPSLDGCVVNKVMPGAWQVHCTLSKPRNLSNATYGNGTRELGSKIVYEDFGSVLIRNGARV